MDMCEQLSQIHWDLKGIETVKKLFTVNVKIVVPCVWEVRFHGQWGSLASGEPNCCHAWWV